jgi:Periplasmic lysozyme inhibitor of I-type lysozyme
MTLPSIAITLLLAAAQPQSHATHDRFIRQVTLPLAKENIVVTEGEFEARSIGSYSIRIYSGARLETPTDDFVAGVIRPRDGVVKDVRFERLLGDSTFQTIVVMQSAGTGSYLSADAFAYKDRKLTLISSVAGLAPSADVIAALKKKIAPAHAR